MTKPLLAVVTDRSLSVSDLESRETGDDGRSARGSGQLGIPFFPTMLRAAVAARKVSAYFARKAR